MRTTVIVLACVLAIIVVAAILGIAHYEVSPFAKIGYKAPQIQVHKYAQTDEAAKLISKELKLELHQFNHNVHLMKYLLKLALYAIKHGYAAPKLVLVFKLDSAHSRHVIIFGNYYRTYLTKRSLGRRAHAIKVLTRVHGLKIVDKYVNFVSQVFRRVFDKNVAVTPLVYSGDLLYLDVAVPVKELSSKIDILARDLASLIKEGLVGFAPDYKVAIPELDLKGGVRTYVKYLFKLLSLHNLTKIRRIFARMGNFTPYPVLEPGKTYPFIGKYPTTLLDVEKFIDALPLYREGINGSGVIIYILDTGVAYDHPSLEGKVITCVSFVPDEPTCYDYNGHGTWVAGIAAGRGVDSEGFFSWWDLVVKYYHISADEMSGVAYGAYIGAVKVLSRYGWGYLDWVVRGIYFAVQDCINKTLNGTAKACVISMSLGAIPWTIPDYDPLYWATLYAMENGVVVVAAAGNEGPGHFSLSTPGLLPTVIGVGAVYLTGLPTFFTSRGPVPYELYMKPDVVAPGAAILGPWNEWYDNIYYLEAWGTSAATPVVSGSVALLLSLWAKYSKYQLIFYGPNVTYAVLAALIKTARMPKVSKEYSMYYLDPAAYGAGIVDVAAAAKALLDALRHGLVIAAFMPRVIKWDTPPTVTLFPGDWKLLAVRIITTVPLDKVQLVVVHGGNIAQWVVPKPTFDTGLPLPVYMGFNVLVPVIIRWKDVYTLGSVCDPELLSMALPSLYGMCYLRIVLPTRPVRLPDMYIAAIMKGAGKVLAEAPIDIHYVKMPRGTVIAADVPVSIWPGLLGLDYLTLYQSLYGGEEVSYTYSMPLPGYFTAWAIAAEHGIRIVPLSDLVYRLSSGVAKYGLYMVLGSPPDPWYVLDMATCGGHLKGGVWLLNGPVADVEGLGIRNLWRLESCSWVFITGLSLSGYGIHTYPGYQLSKDVSVDVAPPWWMRVLTTSITPSPITRNVHLVWMPYAAALAVKPPAKVLVYGADMYFWDWYMYSGPVIAIDRTSWHGGLIAALDPFAFSLGTAAPDLVWLWAFYLYGWSIPTDRAFDNIRLMTNILTFIAK